MCFILWFCASLWLRMRVHGNCLPRVDAGRRAQYRRRFLLVHYPNETEIRIRARSRARRNRARRAANAPRRRTQSKPGKTHAPEQRRNQAGRCVQSTLGRCAAQQQPVVPRSRKTESRIVSAERERRTRTPAKRDRRLDQAFEGLTRESRRQDRRAREEPRWRVLGVARAGQSPRPLTLTDPI